MAEHWKTGLTERVRRNVTAMTPSVSSCVGNRHSCRCVTVGQDNNDCDYSVTSPRGRSWLSEHPTAARSRETTRKTGVGRRQTAARELLPVVAHGLLR